MLSVCLTSPRPRSVSRTTVLLSVSGGETHPDRIPRPGRPTAARELDLYQDVNYVLHGCDVTGAWSWRRAHTSKHTTVTSASHEPKSNRPVGLPLVGLFICLVII